MKELKYIFVVSLKDERHVVGQAQNPTRTIAALNSGLFPDITEERLQIDSIWGIKELNEERTLESTVEKFSKKFGADKVVSLVD